MIREINSATNVPGYKASSNNIPASAGSDLGAVRNMMSMVDQIDATPQKRSPRTQSSDKAGVQKLLKSLNDATTMMDEAEFSYWMPKDAPDEIKEQVKAASLKMRDIMKKYAGIVSRLG